MLKRALVSTTALAALTVSAYAADLPYRKAPPPIVAVPVFTWTGFYVGGNVGGGFTTQRNEITTGLSAGNEAIVASGQRPRFTNTDASGFVGGGQVGYNYQIGGLVIGLEADADYTDLTSRRAFGNPSAGGGTNVSAFRHDLNFLGTVRGRVGYAFDRLLVYGTGGFAYGDVDSRANFFSPQLGGQLAYTGGRAGIQTGWAAGAGVEYAMPNFSLFGSGAVTIKAEALYYDLGRQNIAILNTPLAVANGFVAPGYRGNFETNGVIARAGLNIKFGSY